MAVDISVKDLIPYLPHRPPMVWVSRVCEVGKDYKGLKGTCLIDLTKDCLAVSNGKEIRGSSAIEFTAQAFGYLKAAFQVIHNFNDPPSRTYLTGVRSCRADFSGLDVSEHKQLQVEITVIRELLPVTYVRGEISIPGQDKILAEAEIQVYVD